MHVIVVGAGIVGICTAYHLNRQGVDVTVLDRRSGPAQEASFGNAGVVAAAYASPWNAPGSAGKLLGDLFKAESAVMMRASMSPSLWRWLSAWLGQSRADRYLANKTTMQRLTRYSQTQLGQIRERHELDYEQRTGYLQLLRTEQDLAATLTARTVLETAGIAHILLTPQATLEVEPCLSRAVESGMPLAGAIQFPHDESGNCPLFARQVSGIAEKAGVKFLFNATVTRLLESGKSVTGVRLADGRQLAADAVVLAGGADSLGLLRPLGITPPIAAVQSYTANVVLRPDTIGPRQALVDEAYKVNITPLGQRLRIAGTLEFGATPGVLRNKALRTLSRVGMDWLPGVIDMSRTTWWSGIQAMTPDSLPVIGPTRTAGLFVNIGHGAFGWTMAAGSGQLIADLVTGQTPEIDMRGLGMERYLHRN